MKQKNAPVASGGGPKDRSAAGAIINQHMIIHPSRSLASPDISGPRRMNAADQRGDLPTAYRHFRIWQSLSAARYGLPWPGVL